MSYSKIEWSSRTKAEADAQRWMDEQRSVTGRSNGNPKEKLGAYGRRVLTGRVNKKNVQVSPETERGDLDCWGLYIEPEIGHLKLEDLNADRVQTFIASLAKPYIKPRSEKPTKDAYRSRGRTAGKVLAQNTQGGICARLRLVLKQAMRQRLITRAALEGIEWVNVAPIPSSEKTAIKAPDVAAARAHMETLGDLAVLRFEAWRATGARPGEVAAMTWDNLTILNQGEVPNVCAIYKIERTLARGRGDEPVVKKPKTKNGIRMVILPEDVRGHLLRWREFQEQARAAEPHKLKPGQDWHVLTNRWGTITKHSKQNLASWWNTVRKDAGMPDVSPYDFRYTAGANLLNGNGNHQRAAKYLGHANAAITARVYGPMVESGKLVDDDIVAYATMLAGG